MTSILAIVPARGGSKGIPRKNLCQIGGRPLISYPLEEASKSRFLTEVVVSTDDLEILKFARDLGVNTILRPPSLASDSSPVIDSVLQVLDEYQKKDIRFDIVVLLQPTSPFWRASQLDELLTLFEDQDLEGVVSVVPSIEAHPSRMYDIDSFDYLRPLVREGETVRRQELKPVYFRNGCFYAVRTHTLISKNTLMPSKKKAFLMDPEWFMTIDTPRDLKIANVMAEEWNDLIN